MASAGVEVEIDGRQLRLSNLDKVLYPEAGFTKGEVIDYYTRIAPTMLPHIRERALTFKRFPDGVDGGSFFEKRCPKHRPPWVQTAAGPGDNKGTIQYCELDERPALVWAANMAALELHAPMARAADIETPRAVVFDLDPGAPATIVECARIGLLIHDVLENLSLEVCAKTSGSKGMQLYVPLNTAATHEGAGDFALAVGQLIERAHPNDVTTTMAKAVRGGKVFIDWSQNTRHKTTIAPYSMRARPRPTVSTPVSWNEVEECASGRNPLVFEAADVLERVEGVGDLFAPVLEVEQELPTPS
jgi:bifunctional non-homologous end joining protein LigD